MIRGMQLLSKEKKVPPVAVTVRRDVYERMMGYIELHPLPPKAVDLVSFAVTRYLDEQERIAALDHAIDQAGFDCLEEGGAGQGKSR